jgi:protein-L-isoaspartate(D-aspartate) O-methyltransferase
MPAAKAPQELHRHLISAIWKEGLVRVPGVYEAFLKVPRHLFLPETPLEQAYADEAVPLKYDQSGRLISSCSQPTMIAIMLEQLQAQPGHNVLEIGTASGYTAALLHHIVGPQGYVTSVEVERDLAEQAEKNLLRAKVLGVRVVAADGAYGYLPRAAYDRIIATVGVWDVPAAWPRQLKPDGILVVPISLDGVQVSAAFRPQPDGSLLSADNRPCAFVTMRGEEASPLLAVAVGTTGLVLYSADAPRLDTARLRALMSADHDLVNVEPRLTPADYWRGLQFFLMLYRPAEATFFTYSVAESAKPYGLSGRGLGLLLPGSAVFASFEETGAAHVFGGSEALLLLQALMHEWVAAQRPNSAQLRLRLIPRGDVPPQVAVGRIFTRRSHDLHAWYELQPT